MRPGPVIPAVLIAALTGSGPASAQGKPEPVTAKNFQRAESDLYFGNFVKLGGFGKLYHYRTPTPIEKQEVVRMNRDTLYSTGVFDLDAGPRDADAGADRDALRGPDRPHARDRDRPC
jgi:hypothetical protein